MALTASFDTMLKRYMPYQLLDELAKKKFYMWAKIRKRSDWYGGRLEVPFIGGRASTAVLGAFADSSDISEENDILGYEDLHRVITFSNKFNGSDIDKHITQGGSFIPNLLAQQSKRTSSVITARFSSLVLNGAALDSVTADSTAGGLVYVNFPERFEIGQKVILRNSDPAAAAYYITAIDMNGKVLTVSATRGGSAANVSAYTLAKSSALYEDGGVNTSTGALQNNFNSLRSALLSASNGGDASIHNQTKASYPFLQAYNTSGSGIASNDILDVIYDAVMDVKRIAKGAPMEIICSYKNFAAITKELEPNRDFMAMEDSTGYGFQRAVVKSPRTVFSMVPVEEMNNDVIYIIDWDAIEFAGCHFFKREAPNGQESYVERATTGYSYIVDHKLYGNLIVKNPSHCGVIHSISF